MPKGPGPRTSAAPPSASSKAPTPKAPSSVRHSVRPPPAGRVQVVPATAVRSAVVLLSLDMLRRRGHFAQYREAIAPAHRQSLAQVTPGTWLPIDVLVAHYEACDRLRLPAAEVIALGRGHTDGVHVSVLDLTMRVPGALGVSPWGLGAHLEKYWSRSFRGGALSVVKIGESEGRLEIHGYPCARIPYVRLAWRGALLRGAELVASRVHVSDVATLCTNTSLAYAVSWG